MPRWTGGDAGDLRSFLASPAGLKLGVLLRDRLTRAAANAVNTPADSTRLAWQCGHAAGMHTAVATLDLYASPPEEVSPATSDNRPSDALDWLHPQPREHNAS